MKVNKFVQFMQLVCCSFDFDTKALIFTCVLAFSLHLARHLTRSVCGQYFYNLVRPPNSCLQDIVNIDQDFTQSVNIFFSNI